MLTAVARPRLLITLFALLVVATAGWLIWQSQRALRRSSPEIAANKYLPDRTEIQVKPNASAAAYALYLRARELETKESGQALHAARDLYEEAIAADPTFALAHARLAVVLAKSGTSPGDAEKARTEADKALQLDPKLGDSHFARALLLAGNEQYADAVTEVELALSDRPDDPAIVYLAASLHRRQGKWRQSLEEFQKAVALNARNLQSASSSATDLAYHSTLMRDWAVAVPAWDRALSMVPEWMFNRICRAYVEYWATGDLKRGNALLASFPVNYGGQFKEFLAWMRWDFNLLQRNYPAAEEAVANIQQDPFYGGFLGPITRSYMRGCIELARGNREAATPLFADSCKFFEEQVKKKPGRAQPHARLAMAYAFAGRKVEALEEAAKAREICPESKDAFDGAVVSTGATVALVWAGESDQALAEINRLLRTPGALNYDCSITVNDLKVRWQWDPLRSDPRFQAIINGPEPTTIIR
jgi:tetratricopeptide (TPR) repeat protein